MKEQTQKISLKASKTLTLDRPSLYQTQNIPKQNLRRRKSEHSSGEQFLGFLNDYIQHLKQPSSRKKSIESSREFKLDQVAREIEQESIINKKLSRKMQSIQDILASRGKELDRLNRKVEKLMDKENLKKNANSRVMKDTKYKVSDFIQKGRQSKYEDDEESLQTRNHTENDLRPLRRKSTVVQRNQFSKPILTEELENLISQTVALKASNRYTMI